LIYFGCFPQKNKKGALSELKGAFCAVLKMVMELQKRGGSPGTAAEAVCQGFLCVTDSIVCCSLSVILWVCNLAELSCNFVDYLMYT
jgi:hypothetical protein